MEKTRAVVAAGPMATTFCRSRVMAMASLLVQFIVCQLSNDPFFTVAKAMMYVESRGDPQAIGDGGKAIGVFQIHRAYWADGTRFLGVSWPYSDAKDPAKAIAVVQAYTKHYAAVHGRSWTAEIIAKIHNGGPLGWKKASTKSYWNRVRNQMDGKE